MEDEEGYIPTEEQELVTLAERLLPLASPVRLRLLRYLRRPHYLEEIASYLRISRQGAKKHVDQLVGNGAIERRGAMRSTGPVVEYVIDPQAMFLFYDEFERLMSFQREDDSPSSRRTVIGESSQAPTGPCVVILHGLRKGRRVRLPDKGEFTIGRDPMCDLNLDYDPFASQRHCLLRASRKGFTLVDLRSTNGTSLNLAPLERGAEVHVYHGDLVGVGRSLFLFWEQERPAGALKSQIEESEKR